MTTHNRNTDPELMASQRAGLEEAAAGNVVRHGPGHFAELEAKLTAEIGDGED
jgi:hypothetical protein